MIESVLKEKLRRIFQMKVTFDIASETREQECVFIEVERSNSVIKEKIETASMTGKFHIFANSEKVPFGYVAKCIAKAKAEDVKDLFFFDIEKNLGTLNNIVQRTTSFYFFYKDQYDPEKGTMNKINLTTAVTE